MFSDAVTKDQPIKIADDLSKKLKFSKEDLNNYAIQSCHRAIKAFKEKKFENEIVSITHPKTKKVTGFDCLKTGENIRNLKPLLKNGVVTAGNTCGINDGASFMVLSTRSKAIKEN